MSRATGDDLATSERLRARIRELECAVLAASQARHSADESAAMAAFAAGVAHEIRNPLNFVNNFAAVSVQLVKELGEVLREREGTPAESARHQLRELLADLEQAASRVVEHGRRADDIVHGMMLRGRLAAMPLETVNLNEVVAECCTLAMDGVSARRRLHDPARRVDLTLQLTDDMPLMLLKPQTIRRALINVIGNALDALHEKHRGTDEGYAPTLWVSTEKTDDVATIHIRDNGGGLSPHTLEHLFEPFYSTKPEGEGTGIGLSMARDVIADHGGDISVQSVWGEGADFVVTLPIRPATEAPVVAP